MGSYSYSTGFFTFSDKDYADSASIRESLDRLGLKPSPVVSVHMAVAVEHFALDDLEDILRLFGTNVSSMWVEGEEAPAFFSGWEAEVGTDDEEADL